MNSHFNPKDFQQLLNGRELCALYILSEYRNQPQNLQLFETYVDKELHRWVILPTPVSSHKFFQTQAAQGIFAPEILKRLHKHKDFGVHKKLLVDNQRGVSYAYIPQLREYIRV